jgi:energy-coupling factor transporter transmembrane protein EcfT
LRLQESLGAKGVKVNLSPDKTRRFRIVFVSSAFLFALVVVILAKLVGDGYVVPIVFFTGWFIFVTATIFYLARKRKKGNDG